MKQFELVSSYKPSGDQPKAIKELVEGIESGLENQILLGVTGSGKTYTISNVIQQVQKPTLIISPNKTLAAQLYAEFMGFFPNNAVEFFISYYDYFQPEAYMPATDTYIEKDMQVNDEIDRLRLKTTTALVEGRRDVVVIASVSCIYGLGTREDFANSLFHMYKGLEVSRQRFLYRLSDIYYTRNDYEFSRGTFRVRGDIIDVFPASEDKFGIRIELFGDQIESIKTFSREDNKILEEFENYTLFPAKIFITTATKLQNAVVKIREELFERLRELRAEEKFLEAQRLEQRTFFDIEMMKEVGYCSGIENYSMHLSGREPGERPVCLFDYFPSDFLLIIDESHVTVPQVRGMYNGDRARKLTLVEHGFRLPSALENRPQKFDEFESIKKQTIYVSATPGDYEQEKCAGVVVEQVIRPTGLLDPQISVRPLGNQIDDLQNEVKLRIERKERVLITTLTKRMAEDLSEYMARFGVNVAYIHSDVPAIERVEIIRDLRLGTYDVLVGVNLLREGLDMPEVSLVAILDADKEGFLRSERSLLQIAGRTARNSEGLVILYADKVTRSMKVLIDETNRRRELQIAYNKKHGIDPKTVYKSIEEILASTSVADIQKDKRHKLEVNADKKLRAAAEPVYRYLTSDKRRELLEQMYDEMKTAARNLDFERAAELRDEIKKLETVT